MTSKRIKLRKLNNTRDLGGMTTEDGRTIRSGKLIRSGRLSALPASTVRKLMQLNIGTIIDLRILTECTDHPETLIPGTRYVFQPILFMPRVGITYERTMRIAIAKESKRIREEFGTADNYMIQTYRGILFNEQSRQGLKVFLREAIESEQCFLWHCSSGKDRAGICAMLLEALLGVDEESIIEDYLASRKYLRLQLFFNRLGLVIAPVSFRFKYILFGLMRLKREYFEAVISELKDRYGGIVNYCKSELGVTDEDILVLKNKYLE